MSLCGKCPVCQKIIPGAKPTWLLGTDTLQTEPDLHQEEDIINEEALKVEDPDFEEDPDFPLEVDSSPTEKNLPFQKDKEVCCSREVFKRNQLAKQRTFLELK